MAKRVAGKDEGNSESSMSNGNGDKNSNPPPSYSHLFTKWIIHNCCFWSTAKHCTAVCATTSAAAMPDNNDNAPDNAVAASVHGDGTPK
jgi:hypothetical protein